MSKSTVSSLDENTRRYYLDVMGIQCWQLRNSEKLQDAEPDVSNGLPWLQLETAIQQCNKCPLHKTRQQTVVGRGSQSAELMFVLLSPDANDNEANALFAKMLAAINVSIDDVYITSLLKCNVPANHTVSPGEIQHCDDYLKQQIQLIQPKLLVVLGETAIRCLLQKNLSLDDFRVMNNEAGQLIESVPLFVSYSPQELLQQPDNKRKAWSDLQVIQNIIQS